MAVTGDGSNGGFSGDSPPDPEADGGARRPVLRAIRGGGFDPASKPPPVRLVREYKGLTVADMMRDEIVDKLPGQLRSALHHINRGDYRAAERAVPGEFGEVLAGPGSAPRRSWWLLGWIAVTAALAAATLASRWF